MEVNNMRYSKRIVSGLFAAFLLFLGAFSASAFAETANEYNERDIIGMPIVSCDTVLKQKEWNGKSRLRSNTCYFVDKTVYVTENKTLPDNSMIIVENHGKLVLNENVNLYIKGKVVVHSKADLAVNGWLILKSGSASVINGKLLIGGKGRASIYGEVQVSKGGTIGIKGRAAIHNNGVVLNYGTIKKMSDSAVVPDITECGDDEPQRYIAEEYSDYLDNKMTIYSWYDDIGLEIKEQAEKLKLIRSFESVLYKYDGEFSGMSIFVLNSKFRIVIAAGGKAEDKVWASMYSSNCLVQNREEDGFETEKGCFYSSVLGKVDENLFAKIDPESPLYVHSESTP